MTSAKLVIVSLTQPIKILVCIRANPLSPAQCGRHMRMSPKGDYHRLGHGTDDHVRRPRKVAAPLQGKKVVSVATGSLHCVACTDHGEYDCFYTDLNWVPFLKDVR